MNLKFQNVEQNVAMEPVLILNLGWQKNYSDYWLVSSFILLKTMFPFCALFVPTSVEFEY